MDTADTEQGSGMRRDQGFTNQRGCVRKPLNSGQKLHHDCPNLPLHLWQVHVSFNLRVHTGIICGGSVLIKLKIRLSGCLGTGLNSQLLGSLV